MLRGESSMFSGCSIEGLMAVRPLDKEDDMGLTSYSFSVRLMFSLRSVTYSL